MFNDTSEFKNDRLIISITKKMLNVNDGKHKKSKVAFHQSSLFNDINDKINERHSVKGIM